jgi:hypothetical protein
MYDDPYTLVKLLYSTGEQQLPAQPVQSRCAIIGAYAAPSYASSYITKGSTTLRDYCHYACPGAGQVNQQHRCCV